MAAGYRESDYIFAIPNGRRSQRRFIQGKYGQTHVASRVYIYRWTTSHGKERRIFPFSPSSPTDLSPTNKGSWNYCLLNSCRRPKYKGSNRLSVPKWKDSTRKVFSCCRCLSYDLWSCLLQDQNPLGQIYNQIEKFLVSMVEHTTAASSISSKDVEFCLAGSVRLFGTDQKAQ